MKKVKLVLIIDDDNRNIFALRLALKSRGYQSLSCNSAKEGIALLDSNRDIEIVLMDMMMPDMDGYEAIQVIKSSQIYGDIPVIAVTAQAMQGDREKCIEAGAREYVPKPINLDRLISIIEQNC
ncbi:MULTISPECIES: response regulator [Sphingobacterium]|jgi:CheY-like chemotaxis protein|uniref:response regulator n=1 Tax=Sphingobacterium TaxID=28453 RepID=UPI0004E601B8|nr:MULTISPECIES: response regulator [Sphingobacterium]CDT06259.1 Sensor histidine kinase [Sphingobacterium sp. PM2-P1-29]MQP28294.1 response regulator [Sphingobacterium faecium]UPZ35071.1 response regulator [Sphingobacterium sp. PCS056]UXD70635.1 response regulator [Sphingobacterium faecium]WGQ14206.1 response regulator [Sphingobacterium faecium]